MTDNREYFVNRISELSNRIVDLLEERDNLETQVEQLQAVNNELDGQLAMLKGNIGDAVFKLASGEASDTEERIAREAFFAGCKCGQHYIPDDWDRREEEYIQSLRAKAEAVKYEVTKKHSCMPSAAEAADRLVKLGDAAAEALGRTEK